MKITHLGHAAVLVETNDARLLVDPGNFSDSWHGLSDLDAILVTHQHPDHLDPEHLPALIDANAGARVIVEPSIVAAVAAGKLPPLARAAALGVDESLNLGDVTISACGGDHAVIHRDIPRMGNVGYVLRSEGEPTFFHPGDSLAAVPDGVDLVAIPAMGPWAALKETIDFVRALGALEGFPIHEGLLSARGRGLYFGRLGDMTSTRVVDLGDGVTHRF